MRIRFVNSGYALALWCQDKLEKNGITELPLLDTLMLEQKRLLLHVVEEGFDAEIYIEKSQIELLSKRPIYRFIVLERSSVTITRYSTEFFLE